MNQRFFVIHAQKRAAKVRIVLFKFAFLRYNTTSRLSNLRFCPSTNGHTDEKKTMERALYGVSHGFFCLPRRTLPVTHAQISSVAMWDSIGGHFCSSLCPKMVNVSRPSQFGLHLAYLHSYFKLRVTAS